ncbi:hypothetical protein JET76_23145 [Pseudomonas putida]|uniref:hypothetical protein n=1 Tax=Pseudomonas putida TaxID=303 RepID=UPI0018E699D1|nr:hypothetical protein [Pseudomonas putida]MBI6944226.1 hypothetical protein [Pseudomonas putida]MBI6960327.1 hypothetical protein [Pseudomonas putida]
MKRKATAESIRAGQTLYYVSDRVVFVGGDAEVGRLRVVSDNVPFEPVPGELVTQVPRNVAQMLVDQSPGNYTYSRRAAEAGVRSYQRLLKRLKAFHARTSQDLSLTLRRFAALSEIDAPPPAFAPKKWADAPQSAQLIKVAA